jgi:acyl-CoA thioesterase FadM
MVLFSRFFPRALPSLTSFRAWIYNGLRIKNIWDKKLYPYLKLSKILIKAKFGSPLKLDEESVLKMRVLFGDIDIYPELNNGRHLTLMDMGRLDLAQRSGLLKWGFAVTGASVRYRHRLKAFKRFELRTRIVAIDDRWFYFNQNTIRNETIHSSALVRAGIVNKQGIVPVKKVLDALGRGDWNPGVPDWVEAWSKAEELRPWESKKAQITQA